MLLGSLNNKVRRKIPLFFLSTLITYLFTMWGLTNQRKFQHIIGIYLVQKLFKNSEPSVSGLDPFKSASQPPISGPEPS